MVADSAGVSAWTVVPDGASVQRISATIDSKDAECARLRGLGVPFALLVDKLSQFDCAETHVHSGHLLCAHEIPVTKSRASVITHLLRTATFLRVSPSVFLDALHWINRTAGSTEVKQLRLLPGRAPEV